MASRKQTVKNGVPKPGHNYFLSQHQDRAIDEAGSVSGCCARGSVVIPWVQRWQANIALLSCSRADRAPAPIGNCFLSHDRSEGSVVVGFPPLIHFRCSGRKGKKNVNSKKKKQRNVYTNQSIHTKHLIILNARQMGHFPNPVPETALRTTVQQTNPEHEVFVNGKCFSTLGREDHSTAIRQTYYNYFTLHKKEDGRKWGGYALLTCISRLL